MYKRVSIYDYAIGTLDLYLFVSIVYRLQRQDV